MATNQKMETRARRKRRIKKRVQGTSQRPRLTVFRSNKHIYAQIVDDTTNQSLVYASTLDKEVSPQGEHKVGRAKAVGLAMAKVAQKKGIKRVVFDRNGYAYHGRIGALAEGAREGGLEF
jgi:large subunit ribosomal protein L18